MPAADRTRARGPGSVPPGTNPGGAPLPATCEAEEPGETPLLKLSTAEYKNTVRDLLAASGAGARLAGIEARLDAVPDDSLGDSFRALDNRISLEHVQAYFNVGVAVGDAIAARARDVARGGGRLRDARAARRRAARAPSSSSFGQLAYRRPLERRRDRRARGAQRRRAHAGRSDARDRDRDDVVAALREPRRDRRRGGRQRRRPAAARPPTRSRRGSRTCSGRRCRTRSCSRRRPTARLRPRTASPRSSSACSTDDRTRETLWQFWNEWLRLEKFTGFETTRPGFQSLAEGEAVGEAGHEHYSDMVQEVRDLTELFTFERKGTRERAARDGRVGDALARSRAALRRRAVDRHAAPTRRVPAGTRAGLFQRAALLVSNLETTNPFHRGAFVRRNLLLRPARAAGPEHAAAGLARSAAGDRRRHHARALRQARSRATRPAPAATTSSARSASRSSRSTRSAATARASACTTSRPASRSPICRSTPSGVPRIRARRRAADHERRRAQPAHRREREGRALPRQQVLQLRDAAPLAARHARRLRGRRPRAAAQGRRTGLAAAFQRVAQHSSFFMRKVGAQ